MRLVARRRGCPYAVTEALLDVILLSGGQGLKKSIDINDEDHPVAGQIIGSEPDTMSRAATILAGRGYDVIDLNFACPVKKIKNKARGGHMLQDVPRAVDILKAVRDAVPAGVPTTISLRRGFDDSEKSVDRFHELMETAVQLGYAAVRVHARTVEQKYQGRARWPFLRQIKQQYPTMPIFGSGDVFTAEDVIEMLQTTGVDAVWIARGAIGNPWIFQHARQLLEELHRDTGLRPVRETIGGDGFFNSNDASTGRRPVSQVTAPTDEMNLHRDTGLRPVRETIGNNGFSNGNDAGTGRRPVSQVTTLAPPTIGQQREALIEHFSIAMQIHGESLAGRRMRKMGIKYSRFHPQSEEVKRDFINVHSLRDWTAVLDRWYPPTLTDAPGVWPAASAADEVNDQPSLSCGID
jgi:nifR3 family TIM-barrel protein